MKGPDDSRIREAVAYLHGRLEIEIDYYCERKGISSLEVAPLVGAALGGSPMDHMPAMHPAPRQAHPPAPEMEVADGAHGGGAQAAKRGRPRKDASGEVSQPKSASGYWAKMTPGQRSREMKRRQRVSAKQKVYMERSRLRKQGVPEDQLPALPQKLAQEAS